MPEQDIRPLTYEGLEPLEMPERLKTPRERLESLRTPVPVEGRPMTDPMFKRVLLKLIPGLSGFVGGTGGVAGAVAKVFEMQHHATKAVEAAKEASHWTHVALAVVDFIILPASWLIAWGVLGERPKIDVPAVATLGYALVLLGLSLTAIFVPVTAPFITGAILLMGFGVATLALRNFFKARDEAKETFFSAKEEAEALELSLDSKRAAAAELINALDADEVDEELLVRLEGEISYLQNRLQEARDTQVQAKQMYDSLDKKVATDKAVGFALSAVVLVGAALIFPFGVWGVAVIGVAASLGTLYTLGRIIDGLVNKKDTENAVALPQDGVENAEAAEPDPAVVPEPAPAPADSTRAMAEHMAPNHAEAAHGLRHAGELAKLQATKLDWLDNAGRVAFFEDMCKLIAHETHPATPAEVLHFLRNECEGFTPELARDFVEHVRKKPELLSQDARELLLTILVQSPLQRSIEAKPASAMDAPTSELRASEHP